MTAITSQTGIESPTNITGAADGNTARLRELNDVFVLDLSNTLSSGATFTMRWYQNSGTVTVAVATSADGVTFNAVTGSPFSVSSGSLVDQNATANGNTRYVRITNTNGQRLEMDAITYTNQSCVTASAPGGVSTNLQLWLKANTTANITVGSGKVTSWQNEQNTAHNFVGVSASEPNYVSNSVNFNPALTAATGKYLQYSGAYTSSTSPHSAIMVSKTTVAGDGFSHLVSATSGFNPRMTTAGSTTYSLTSGSYSVIGNGIAMGVPVINTITRASTTYDGIPYQNGVLGTSSAGSAPIATAPALTQVIGRYQNGGASVSYPTGDIPEIIYYSAVLSATERARVESYLALKYGITMGTGTALNYTASDGTTVYWTGNATYQNNVAGIVRDDASALSQKQSESVNTGLQVVMGNGNTIATDNATNTNTFSADKSALVWGDNAGSVAAWTTTDAPPSRQIVARKWKVQETGTVGYVKIQIPDNSGANGLPAETNTVYLLADADGNFASGATEYPMSLNGTNWEALVDFTTGQFFTFATQDLSPVSLTLAMTGDRATVSSGQNIIYTLTLTNTAATTATNVQVKDQLPAGVSYLSSTPSAGTYNSATGIWTIPSIATGAQTLTITVTAQ